MTLDKGRQTITASVIRIINLDRGKFFASCCKMYLFRLEETGENLSWTTATNIMVYHPELSDSRYIKEGDIVSFTCTVCDSYTYKDEEQIKINRCKDFTYVGHSNEADYEKKMYYEQRKWKKQLETSKQLETVGPKDTVERMEYYTYCHHYRNHEMVKNSYREEDKTVLVIIRN